MTEPDVMVSQKLRDVLASAREVVVFTGAGISAESGVPTFRGDDGIWKKFKPKELASFDAFMKNPLLVWEWYRHRKQLIMSIQPNAGHVAIAEMERSFHRATVITQNIDNLHRRAGSTNIHELHGNITRNYCIGCGRSATGTEVSRQNEIPRCPACGDLIRPDVVWFGEYLPEEAWNESVKASEGAELFLAVGTSGVVYPAASLPRIAKDAGAYVVEINIERTDFSGDADEVICGTAGSVLPSLAELAMRARVQHF